MASSYRRPQPPRPQRKGMATWSLVLGILSVPCMGLFGIGALLGLILGIMALVKANREPTVYGGSGMAIGGIVTSCLGLVLLPILAAISIPSLLRARVSANEAQTIGDIRTVISAQQTYASTNGGYFDTLDCLATPTSCIPEYPAQAPHFLGTDLASASVKSGFERTFYPGLPVDEVSPTQSPSSMRSFAYVAVPATLGVTGVRAFCGDSDGGICVMVDGVMPEITDGICPNSCPNLN